MFSKKPIQNRMALKIIFIYLMNEKNFLKNMEKYIKFK